MAAMFLRLKREPLDRKKVAQSLKIMVRLLCYFLVFCSPLLSKGVLIWFLRVQIFLERKLVFKGIRLEIFVDFRMKNCALMHCLRS